MKKYLGEDKFKSSSLSAMQNDDQIQESQSMTVSQSMGVSTSKGKETSGDNYDTDTFEEQSQSASHSKSADGSGKKSLPHESSYTQSVSQSKDQSQEVFSKDRMEEYLRKQAEKKAAAQKSVPGFKKDTPIDVSGSSDKYSDEFESYSKSQSAIALPKGNAMKGVSQSVEGKITQTVEGKYSYMDAKTGGYSASGREKALERNLEDLNL